MDKIKAFRRSPKKYIITAVLCVMLIALAIYTYAKRAKENVDYRTILDHTAITVEHQDRSFREVAFYVAYEEASVEEQALIYDREDPGKYWNMHVDGVFVRLAARNAAARMALHDEIFYQMAMKEDIQLSEEDRESLKNKQMDFWYDLSDEDKQERLGVSQEVIFETMERMVYAQKMQMIYANTMNEEYSYYDFSEPGFDELLKSWDATIHEKEWEQLRFGAITLNHS